MFLPTLITHQLILGQVSFGSNPPFTLCIIYAANDREDRSSLWDLIISCAPVQSSPWILMGDFYYCRFSSEKIGGNPLLHTKLEELSSLILYTKPEELNLIGNVYTWFN